MLFLIGLPTLSSSCFLAIKYGGAAMAKTNPSRGKEFSGGSIILTASGMNVKFVYALYVDNS